MAFEFKKDRQVIYPVTIETLPENGKGKMKKQVIHARFKLLTRPEYTAWSTGDWDFFRNKKADNDAEELNETDLALATIEKLSNSVSESSQQTRLSELVKRVVDWDEKDVVDQNGNPVPFDAEFLADIFEQSPVYATSFEEALFKASRDAPAKN